MHAHTQNQSRTTRRLALIGLGLLLAACGSNEPTADFRFLNSEPETIDPGRVGDQAGGRIVSNLFEGLTIRDHSLRPQPAIATEWSVSEDGLRWSFHLRDSAWSDGTALTSEDFRWSWIRLLDPATASKSAHLLHPIRGAREFNSGKHADPSRVGIHAPDPKTLVVELDRPLNHFDEICALPPLAPTPRHVIEAHGQKWTRPAAIVSNGPFVLETWRLHDRLRLRRNPQYWNADAIDLDIVDAVSGDFANANFSRYASGLLDWVDSGGVPPTLVDALSVRDDWHTAPFLATYFLRCNTERPPLDDSRVRRALQLAIDAKQITEYVTRAGQTPAHSLVPPVLPDYRPATHRGFDPEFARTLLADAGYPGGRGFPETTLLISTSEWHRQIAEVLQQQWRSTLGIEISIQNQEWKVFSSTVRSGEYDIARGSWIADFADPSNFVEIFRSGGPNNRTGLADSTVDSLLDVSVQQRGDERLETLRRAEEIVVVEEAAILPIYFYSITNLFDASRWTGLAPDAMNTLDLRRVHRREGPTR